MKKLKIKAEGTPVLSMPPLKPGDVLQVIGRRWFNNGNTYHSVEVIINGVQVHRNPFSYGYDRQYEQTALTWIRANYVVPAGVDEYTALWRLRDHGIMVNSSVSDVSRRKDL